LPVYEIEPNFRYVDVLTKNINSNKFGIIPKYGIDNEYHEWREQSQGNYEFEFSYIIPFK